MCHENYCGNQEQIPVRSMLTLDLVHIYGTSNWTLSFHTSLTIHYSLFLSTRALEKEKSRTKMNIYPWILHQRCIDILPIVTAPTPLRNKCELTFGYQYMFPEGTTSTIADSECAMNDAATVTGVPIAADEQVEIATTTNEIVPLKVPAVGFMVTGWAGGVSYSNTLPNMPYEVSMIVDIVNSFLLNSPLVPYDCKTHTGFWRILTIRTSRRTKECMIIIQHNSPTSDLAPVGASSDNCTNHHLQVSAADMETKVDTNTIFANEKERLISLLINANLLTDSSTEAVPTIIKVTSIFFQEFSGLSNPPPEHPVQVRFLFCHLPV